MAGEQDKHQERTLTVHKHLLPKVICHLNHMCIGCFGVGEGGGGEWVGDGLCAVVFAQNGVLVIANLEVFYFNTKAKAYSDASGHHKLWSDTC